MKRVISATLAAVAAGLSACGGQKAELTSRAVVDTTLPSTVADAAPIGGTIPDTTTTTTTTTPELPTPYVPVPDASVATPDSSGMVSGNMTTTTTTTSSNTSGEQ